MIRIANESDVPEILEIYAPYILTTTASFEYTVPSREEFSRRFAKYTAQFLWLVWEEGGRLLGYAYASAPFERAAYAWCAEPSIYLRPEALGTGIAGALYDALERLLEQQGYQVLYALISAENRRSVRFHKKRGYRLRMELPACGFKFQRWIGLLWLEKRLKIVKNPSAPPVPWLSIVQNIENFPDILDNLSLS